jgi:hypothetical protein
MKAAAAERGIVIEQRHNAAGMTGRYQPMDVRLNGEVNSRVNDATEEFDFSQDVISALTFELEAWNAVSRENVIKSWVPLLGSELVDEILAAVQ